MSTAFAAWQRCSACERRIPSDAEVCSWCLRPVHFEIARHSAGITRPGRAEGAGGVLLLRLPASSVRLEAITANNVARERKGRRS